MNMAVDFTDLIRTIKEEAPDILGISLRNLDPLGNRHHLPPWVPFAITLDLIKKWPSLPLLGWQSAFPYFQSV